MRTEGTRVVRQAGWPSPAVVMIVLTTALAVSLRLFLISRPGYLYGLTEYDDGPYFGSAVRLLQGFLPYRDFVFVQPPGITLLMAPVALLAKVTGTVKGIAAGRIVTALASSAGVTMAGLLVRHRGALAVTIAGGVLAVYPDSVAASRTVPEEPWLALFCLIGAVVIFDRDRLTDSSRRLVWGGAAFGFAGVVEAWAIVPVLVVLALMVPHWRRAALFAGGVAGGFLVPVLPFAAIAPKRLYQSLITAQVGPRSGVTRIPLWYRLKEMTGLSDTSLPGRVNIFIRQIFLYDRPVVAFTVVVLLLLTVGALAVATLITRRPPAALEWFAVVTMLLVVAMFLWPSQFWYHFPGFLAPFIGLSIALPVSRLVSLAAAGAGSGAATAWPVRSVAALAVAVLVVFTYFQVRAEGEARSLVGPQVTARIDSFVPPGSCVASDEVSLLVVSGRFISRDPGCSPMLDGRGTDLALSGGLQPGTGAARVPAVRAVWMGAFQHARFILLSHWSARRVAWFPVLQQYFSGNFSYVMTDPRGDALYQRRGSSG